MTVYGQQKEVPEKPAKRDVDISGWIDVQYKYDVQGEVESSVMQIRRARLDVRGTLSPWVDFRLQSDFSGSQKLLDAYMRVRLGRWIALQAGQFKTPLSIENNMSPLDLELTENTMAVSALCGYKDVTGVSAYSGGREVGVMAMLSGFEAEVGGKRQPIVHLNVGLFGGAGINLRTDNMSKDVSMRLDVCPFVPNLKLSASGYWGRYRMLMDGVEQGIDGDRIRYAVGVEYDDKSLYVRSEYVCGNTGMMAVDALTNTGSRYELYSQGYYVVAGYWISLSDGGMWRQKIRPLLRYESYDKDKEAEQGVVNYTAGCEWWLGRHLRMQLAYTLTQDAAADGSGHSVTAMATVRF